MSVKGSGKPSSSPNGSGGVFGALDRIAAALDERLPGASDKFWPTDRETLRASVAQRRTEPAAWADAPGRDHSVPNDSSEASIGSYKLMKPSAPSGSSGSGSGSGRSDNSASAMMIPQSNASRSKPSAENLITPMPEPSYTGRHPQMRLDSLRERHASDTSLAPALAPRAGGAPAPATPLQAGEARRVGLADVQCEAEAKGITPLYCAVLHNDTELVKAIFRQSPKLNANTHVATEGVPMPLAVRAARLGHKPASALELAIALNNEAMVELLMEHGALLQAPKQLSLSELAERARAAGQCAQHAPASLRRGGQLAGVDESGLFDESFLEDEAVARTLGWRDYEGALLQHASAAIVERILKRQGYQLTLSMATNPHACAALFERAVAEGNAYVVAAMAAKGVQVNDPTFKRQQWPLCVAINTLQPNMVTKLLKMGANVHAAEGAAALAEPAAAGGPQRWYPLPNACLMLLKVAEDGGWPHLEAETPRDERYALCAMIIEALLVAGAVPGKATIEQLAAQPPLAGQPAEVQQRYTSLLRILLGQLRWSPATHAAFPAALRDAVRLQLLCSAGRAGAGHEARKGVPTIPDAIVEEEEEEEEEQEQEQEQQEEEQEEEQEAEAAVQEAGEGLDRMSIGSSNVAAEGDTEGVAEALDESATLQGLGEAQLTAIRGMVYPISKWLTPADS